MIGKVVTHYRIIEKLGSGGMGVVYKAQDLLLDRFVALKFLSPLYSYDEESKQTLIYEAKSISSFQHPNICTIHEIDETTDGQLFICMDYYQGETLKEKLKNTNFNINQIIEIFDQVLEGLNQAHSKNIIHRDINPSNIFITKDNIVKIIDFGLAKNLLNTISNYEYETEGTFGYMSPEQIKGEEVDKRTDIWSLGATIYQMLYKKLPFKGDYDQAILFSILNEEVEFKSVLKTKKEKQLIELLKNCLVKNKEKRISSVEEIKNKLNKISGKGNPYFTKSTKLISISVLIISIASFWITNSINFIKDNDEWKLAVLPLQILSENNEKLKSISEISQSLIVENLVGFDEIRIYDHISLNESLINTYGDKIPKGKQLNDFLSARDITYYVDSKLSEFRDNYKLHFSLIKTKGIEIIFTKNYTVKSEVELPQSINKLVSEILNYYQIVAQLTDNKTDLKPWLQHRSQNMGSIKAFLTASQYNFHGEKKLAVKYLRKAIVLDSNFISPRIWLINTLSWLEDTIGAKIEFQKLKPLEPHASPFELTMIEWSNCLINKDYFNQINHLNVALQYSPNNNMLLYNLARAYYLIEDHKKCIDILSELIDLGWKYSPAHFMLGLSYMRLGENQKAKVVFEDALDIKPVYHDLYSMLSQIYFLENDSLKGREFEQKCINRAMESGFSLGIVYSFLGKQNYYLDFFEQSVEYYKMAIQIDSGKAEFHNGYGDALLEVQDTLKAIEEFNKAIKINKNLFEPYYALATIYELRKDYGKAILYYNTCININYAASKMFSVDDKLLQLKNKLAIKN
ncbi:MAG: protein kinase [Ignavibacteriales bacterium]|nr:protein kinase [Ignavibacteriales bacterium]